MIKIDKAFSVDDIELFRNDDDVDFAEVKLYALADGNNSHKNPIKEETLKKYGNSILGKFIIGKYSELARDTTTHVPSQSILGYVPKDQEVLYEKKDGKTFITVIGLLSKLYATDVVQMFKRDNFRNVSCEFSCLEDEEDEDGNKEILEFSIHGITILGLRYQPSCAGAQIEVIKFSEKENEGLNPLVKFANARRKEMAEKKSYKINKTELKDGSWGDVDKTSLRNDIMDASNRDSLVNSVYLLVEDGWEDAPSEHLKYPVMELSGDTLYYNKNAFSSAKGYAESQNEEEVLSKLKKLYKKFKLEFPEEDSKGKEQEMSKKEFEIEGREAWGDVIKKVEDHEGDGVYVQSVEKDHIIFKKDNVVYRVEADVKAGKDDKNVSATIDWDTVKKDKVQKDFSAVDLGNLWCRTYDCLSDRYPSGDGWGSIYCIQGVYEEDNKKFAVVNRKGEDALYRLDISITEKGFELGDEIIRVEQEFKLTDDIKKFAKYFDDMKKKEFEDDKEEDDDDDDKKEDKDDKKEDKEKKLSLDSNAEVGALYTMLVEETKNDVELSQMVSTFTDNDTVIMDKFVKEFVKIAKEKKEFEAKETEAIFNKSMADVKGDIEEKEYAKLFEEGKEIKDKDKMKEFSIRVKSFAYEYIKTNNPNSDFRYGNGNYNSNKPDTSTSVWDRISNK